MNDCKPAKTPLAARPAQEVKNLELRFIEHTKNIGEIHFRELLTLFIKDSEFWNHFTAAPAAKRQHSAFSGGLLLHTVHVADICAAIEPGNGLLMTGALLHDVGKMFTYASGKDGLALTREGALLDHIFLGCQFVEIYIRKINDFPVDQAILLKHLIASHHGRLEWGSPVLPMIEEAIILHHADMIASRLEAYREAAAQIPPGKSGYSEQMRQYIYNRGE
jgi:3'-5' exoribonuclease